MPKKMSEEKRKVLDEILNKPLGRIVGEFRGEVHGGQVGASANPMDDIREPELPKKKRKKRRGPSIPSDEFGVNG